MNSFTIKAKLPSLNEYTNACRANKYIGAKFKKDIETLIGYEIKQALTIGKLRPTDKPCKVRFTWCETNAKRDCDNIASAKKYILDAMQAQKIIKNDNQKYIVGFEDIFIKGKRNYVLVELLEV